MSETDPHGPLEPITTRPPTDLPRMWRQVEQIAAFLKKEVWPMKTKTLGDKCANCDHMRGDHSFFVGICAHVFDNPERECRCQTFVEPKVKVNDGQRA